MISYRKILRYTNEKEVLFEGWELLSVEFLSDAPSEIISLLENVK